MDQPEYRIVTDNGELMRVTVEHGVRNPEELIKLQRRLARRLPGFQRKDPADFHMTILHFGKPSDVYTELQAVNADLTFEEFLQNLYLLLDATGPVVPKPFELPATGLAEFGNPQSPTIVLTLATTPTLEAERTVMESEFDTFLRRCGVLHEDSFIDANKYLLYQRNQKFRPHVSLGRLREDPELPDLDVADITVKLTPSRLRNVEVNRPSRRRLRPQQQ